MSRRFPKRVEKTLTEREMKRFRVLKTFERIHRVCVYEKGDRTCRYFYYEDFRRCGGGCRADSDLSDKEIQAQRCLRRLSDCARCPTRASI